MASLAGQPRSWAWRLAGCVLAETPMCVRATARERELGAVGALGAGDGSCPHALGTVMAAVETTDGEEHAG